MYTSPKPYPYIPKGRSILYVPEDDPFMAQAKQAREQLSTDQRYPTGGVLVKEEKIIGIAANQASLRHPALIRFHESTLCVRRVFKVPSGKHYWLCPGCASHQNHCEMLTVNNARSQGHNTQGADFYLYGHWWCCEPCWKAMIEANIRQVYLVEGATERFG